MTACIVAANAGAVVVENLRDAINVIAARIAGDEPLDQLAADKRPDILVVENRIQRRLQILRAVIVKICQRRIRRVAQSRRQHDIVEQQFCIQVVLQRHEHHRVRVIRAGAKTCRQTSVRLVSLVIIPAGERLRESADNRALRCKSARDFQTNSKSKFRPATGGSGRWKKAG